MELEGALRQADCDVQVDVNTRAGIGVARRGVFEVRVNRARDAPGGDPTNWVKNGHRVHDGPLIACTEDGGRPYKTLRALDMRQVAADAIAALNTIAAEGE